MTYRTLALLVALMFAGLGSINATDVGERPANWEELGRVIDERASRELYAPTRICFIFTIYLSIHLFIQFTYSKYQYLSCAMQRIFALG